MPKIKFTTNRPWLSKESNSCPYATAKTLPDWYKKADIYAMNHHSGKPWLDPETGGKISTWKSCPAILDVMTSGYVLKTPCDIEFYINDRGKIDVKVLDLQYQDFCHSRPPMEQFQHPLGYYEDHFAWWIDWGIEVPDGYSVLYTHPLNRFELPFLSVSGVVDNDKVKLSGTFPFFVIKGWTGVLPAGTPYAQLFPFKREDWESEIIEEDPKIIYEKNLDNYKKYRVKDGGVYKNKIWERRKYV